MADIYAASGRYSDIQAAVSQAVKGDNVHIPAGVWNFLESGEQMSASVTVNVPAGVNVFGAPTQRTIGYPVPAYGRNPNDQVVAWNTVLIIPADGCAPSGPSDQPGPTWFSFSGSGDPSEPSRISDIKLAGYRSLDPGSLQMTEGIRFLNVAGFRVDHCHLENLCGMGVRVGEGAFGHIGHGVIDHNRIENPAGGVIEPWGYTTIIYGISLSRGTSETDWDPDISNVLGKYTEYSTYIEDNYFSKWRHSIVGNMGVHYVNRHNTFDADYGLGTVDAHGGNIGTLGTRAHEHYNNEFINVEPNRPFNATVLFWRGGGGVCFDNYEDGSYEEESPYEANFVLMSIDQGPPECWPQDAYIWNNTHGCYFAIRIPPDVVDRIRIDQEVFLRPPSITEDGWEYSPYEYPHPLVNGAPPPPRHLVTVTSGPITGVSFTPRRVG